MKPTYTKPDKAPPGPSCFYLRGRECPKRGCHPITGKPCCTHFADTQLDDVFKCPACLEAHGMPQMQTRFSRESGR